MTFYVYILRSLSSGRYYVGQTNDIVRRLEEHQRNESRATRGRGPWEVVHVEEFTSRREAMERERALKRLKSAKVLREIIQAGQPG